MITAIAWPTPHHRLRRSLSSRRSLLVSASANYRHPPCLIIAPNHAPVAADSAAGREGWRSQTEGEIFKGTDGACADPGTQNFPCHGARTQPTFPPSSFISLTFTSHTGSLLLSSLKKVTFPPFSSSLRPFPVALNSARARAAPDRCTDCRPRAQSGRATRWCYSACTSRPCPHCGPHR